MATVIHPEHDMSKKREREPSETALWQNGGLSSDYRRFQPFVLAARCQNHSVVNDLAAKRSQLPFKNR